MTGGFFRPFGDRLVASSGDELRALLDQVDVAVPRRTEGRRHEHRERWCIVHYLRTLERNGLLRFPFAVCKTEPPAPDFQVELGSDLVGIEVSDAGSEEHQRATTELERTPRGSVLEGFRSPPDFGDEPEREWTEQVLTTVRKKSEGQLPTYPELPGYRLLIYDNTGLSALTAWTVTELPARLAAALHQWRDSRPGNARFFEEVSVLRDRVLMYDVTGRSLLLPVPPSPSLPPLLPLTRLGVTEESLQDFCRRHRIRKLGFFGSVRSEDERFGPQSDVDVLVEFEPEVRIGFIGLAGVEIELGGLLQRKVDLRTVPDLSRYFREEVVRKETDFAYARVTD